MRILLMIILAGVAALAAAGCADKAKREAGAAQQADSLLRETATTDTVPADSMVADSADTTDDFDTLEPDRISTE